MKPRFLLLLALIAITVTFMAFLITEKGSSPGICEKTPCCKEAVPAPGSSGGGEIDNGSFNHLIVSTIK